MSMPRDFFEKMVKPVYEAWLADPLIEWKAKAAVSNADTMAERVFTYWEKQDNTKVAKTRAAAQYRTHLRENVCADFGLIWDIHDGHKHVVLSRPNRQVTRFDQTGVGQMAYGEGVFGEGVYGGGGQMVVELDDGSKRALSAVMLNVMRCGNGC
jgi:hypothetical protein